MVLPRDGARRGGSTGFSLVEMAIVLAVLCLVAALLGPNMMQLRGRLRVRLAAAELSSTLHLARIYAMRHNTNVAVKFFTGGGGRVGGLLGHGTGLR